jgi:Tfp pilus assembly protein PilV
MMKNQKGIGLVEVIAALGISFVVITSLVSLSIYTLRTSQNSKLLLKGTQKAQQEIELVRAYRDSVGSWETGFITTMIAEDCVSECHMETIPLAPSSGGIDEDELTWYFTATDPSDGGELQLTDQVARISVFVEWTVGTQTKSTRIYTDLTNWEDL